MVRRLVGALALTLALGTVGSERAQACSCIGPIVACESAWTTDAIFVGKVLHVGPAAATGDQFPSRQRPVRFDVTEAFKGVPLGELVVMTGQGGGDCGYAFAEGRTYIVYAHRSAATGQLGAGICSRTAPVEQAGEDLAYLRGPFVTPAEEGPIRGTVTRYDPAPGPNLPSRRTPFAGADIRLEGYARAWTTTSGEDGAYEFRVPPGEYRMFVNVRDGVYSMPGTEGRTVWLRDARGCGRQDIAVRADSRMAGRLLDTAGRPVPFMSVEVVQERQLQSASFSTSTRTATDEQGRFEFRQLEGDRWVPGLTIRRNIRDRYDLAVWLAPTGDGLPAATTVEPEGRVQLGDVRLPPGVSTMVLTGAVVAADGAPVDGATVRFMSVGQGPSMLGAPVSTPADGRFAVSVIAGRSYHLVAEWSPKPPLERRFVSARSAAFDAVGELAPFRLVLGIQ